MTTRLRLLLDECLQGELAEEIRSWKKVTATWVCDLPSLRNRMVTDEELMKFASASKSILVTVEGRLNERRFEICTHDGIIVFQAPRRHESVKAQIFKRLMLCGQRKLCKHAVTYLRGEEIVFRRKGTDGKQYDTRVKL